MEKHRASFDAYSSSAECATWVINPMLLGASGCSKPCGSKEPLRVESGWREFSVVPSTMPLNARAIAPSAKSQMAGLRYFLSQKSVEHGLKQKRSEVRIHNLAPST